MRAPRSRSPRTSSQLTAVQRREVHKWVEENFTPDQHMGGDDGQHVKRPLNAFMLYKKHKLDTRHADGKHDSIDADSSGKEHLCARIASMWKALSDSERAVWYDRAREWKRRHEEAFPGYKYIPRRGSNGKHLAPVAIPYTRPSLESPHSSVRPLLSQHHFSHTPESDHESYSPNPATMPGGWTPSEDCGPFTMQDVTYLSNDFFSSPMPTFPGLAQQVQQPQLIFDLTTTGPEWDACLYTNTFLGPEPAFLQSPMSETGYIPSPVSSQHEDMESPPPPYSPTGSAPAYEPVCAPAQPQAAIDQFAFDAFGTDLQQQQPAFGPGPIFELQPQLVGMAF